MALAACVYLSVMANTGCASGGIELPQAHYAAQQINQIEGYSVDMSKPFFKEFVVKCPKPVAEINEILVEHWASSADTTSRAITKAAESNADRRDRNEHQRRD